MDKPYLPRLWLGSEPTYILKWDETPCMQYRGTNNFSSFLVIRGFRLLRLGAADLLINHCVGRILHSELMDICIYLWCIFLTCWLFIIWIYSYGVLSGLNIVRSWFIWLNMTVVFVNTTILLFPWALYIFEPYPEGESTCAYNTCFMIWNWLYVESMNSAVE